MRARPEAYQRLELRAHALLAGVPLHDVWVVELEDGGAGRSLVDLLPLLSLEATADLPAPVRLLFALRARLGRVFAWDREPPSAPGESFLHRLSSDDRERSLVPPGTPQGPFRSLFVSPREAIAEVRNATVHAFSVLALEETAAGERLYWAIHVRPVGRITRWYMALIDPFRRLLIYPALLRHLRAAWRRGPAADHRGGGGER